MTDTAALATALSDRYVIERELGAGGMATVYLATDRKHDRQVALKVLRPELTAVLGAERFLNEVRITARLDHPHILTLIDSGADAGRLWYVVPYIRGESLRQKLQREKQLGLDEALAITRQVAGALDYAHRQGVIHRDIKPENILLHEGEAVLADFGIALALREAGGDRLTETGLSLGTPQYMSPEQATGDRALDARSDVYSLGAVLYEMLTGDPPHTGNTVQAVIARLMTERPTPVRTVRDTVPEGVDAAVARALAKVPADRFASAAGFGDALAAAATPARGAASTPARLPRWLVPAAVIAAAAAALGWLALGRRGPEPGPRSAVEPVRTQYTFSGDVTGASIAPDGQSLALGRRTCDAEGLCTHSITVQDIRGAGAQVLVEGWNAAWVMEWSPDGRWLILEGTSPQGRWGGWLVPALGGEPRYLGSIATFLGSADTLLIDRAPDARTDSTTLLVATTADGIVRDTIRLARSHPTATIFAVPAPGGRLLFAYAPGREGVDAMLVTRDGQVHARESVELFTMGGNLLSRPIWLADTALVWVRSDPSTPTAVQVMRRRVDPTRATFGGPATVVFGLDGAVTQLTFAPGTGVLAATRAAGTYQIHAAELDATAGQLRSVREIGSVTRYTPAQVSPSGRWVAVQVPTPGGAFRSEIRLHPFEGGPSAVLVPPTDSLERWEWVPDQDVLHFTVPDGNRQAIMAVTPGAGAPQRVGEIPVRWDDLWDFEPLQGGGVAWVPQNVRTLNWAISRGDTGSRELPTLNPTWISSAPTGEGLGVMGWSRPAGDSLRVELLTSLDGEPRLLWAGVVEGGRGAWLPDGSIYAILDETSGTTEAWTITTDGRPATRHGRTRWNAPIIRIATDGRRASVVDRTDRSDAWLISDWQ